MPEPGRAVTKRLPDLAAIEGAADLIRPIVAPTPRILWPLLSQRAGAEVWVKHENHTLIGAFKIRGGLIYMHELKRREPTSPASSRRREAITPRARRAGLRAVIHVPHGNSTEKNAAMRAQAAEAQLFWLFMAPFDICYLIACGGSDQLHNLVYIFLHALKFSARQIELTLGSSN